MNKRGEVTEAGSLRFVRTLPGPIERVWSYFADPDKRAEWLAGGEIGTKPGDKTVFDFDHDRLTPHNDPVPEKYADAGGAETFVGEITAFDPPRHMAFKWPERSGGWTLVTVDLSETEDGRVRLVLVHDGIVQRSDALGAAAGWHVHLDILLDKLSGRAPPPFWSTHEAAEADYEAELGDAFDRFAAL
ncbi:MAG: SRPBCC family protein [Pseudomonadota bacterium]